MIAALDIQTAGVAAAITAAIVGILFKGAASAWRSERDAAIERAGRGELRADRAEQRIVVLEQRVATLEKLTDFTAYADQTGREHREMIEALHDVRAGLSAMTTAVEFLIRRLDPETAAMPSRQA